MMSDTYPLCRRPSGPIYCPRGITRVTDRPITLVLDNTRYKRLLL